MIPTEAPAKATVKPPRRAARVAPEPPAVDAPSSPMVPAVAVAPQPFEAHACEVLTALRQNLLDILSALGFFRKASDLRHLLDLDATLAWQIMKIANASPSPADLLSVGRSVPSRTSVEKFCAAALRKGAPRPATAALLSTYKAFERLVDAHAGDRTTFNSMIAAAAGNDSQNPAAAVMDDEWLAQDLQHRRNMFRGAAHITGFQTRLKIQCSILSPPAPGASTFDGCLLVGYVGLRLLRPHPKLKVFRIRALTEGVTRHPLHLGDGADGYYLDPFANGPRPDLTTSTAPNGWITTHLNNLPVGITAEKNLLFGMVFRGNKLPTNGGWGVGTTADKPAEAIVADLLIPPGFKNLMAHPDPEAEMKFGESSIHGDYPTETIPLLGNFKPQFLGHGPDALATPEIPNYVPSLHATAGKLGWNLSNYEAWRTYVQFPMFHSTLTVGWSAADGS